MDAPADVHGLLHESAFRRFVVTSMALHVGLVGFALYAPRFPSRPRVATVVMVEASLPTPALPRTSPKPPQPPAEPDPTPPPPPEEKAEEPAPEPPVEETPPPQPEQKVEEAIVIPKEPPPRPRDRAKVEEPPQAPPEAPKPRPKVAAKAETPKPEPPKVQPKPKSAAELIAEMRANLGDTPGEESPEQPSGGPGIVDAELAAYQQLLLNCFYQNWLGTQQYRRRRDLQVEFEVRVTPEGGVLSIDKVRESGVSQLDLSAARAIQTCAPGNRLPAPPPGHNRLRFTFVPGDKT